MSPNVASRGNAVGRVFFTTVDQAFSSLSNFAVGVVVARIAGPTGLGAYAVAYALWLLLATIHRSLIVEPMTIDGDARHPLAPRLLGSGASAEIILGAIAAGITMLGALVLLRFERTYGLALLTLAPFLPFLLLQDYCRWVGFMQAKPGKALANDAVFNCTQGVVLVLLLVNGLMSPEIAIFAWGLGAVAGSVFGYWQFRFDRFTRGGISLFRSRWHMSKWLTAGGFVGWGTTQSYPILAAGILGPAGIGGLRAAQSLVQGPANVLVQAGGSIGLPESSKAWDERGWPGLRRVSNIVTVAGLLSLGLIAVVVLVAGKTLLTMLYGAEFGKYATTADLFALCGLIQAFGLGAILTLKTTKQPRVLFHVGLVALVVTSAAVVVLSWAWGVNGAAFAILIASATAVVGLVRGYRRTAHSLDSERPSDVSTVRCPPGVPPRWSPPGRDVETELFEKAGRGSDAWAYAGAALKTGDYGLTIEHLRIAAANFRAAAQGNVSESAMKLESPLTIDQEAEVAR